MDYSAYELKIVYLFGLQIFFFVVVMLILLSILILTNISGTTKLENIVLVALIFILIWVTKDKLLDIPNIANKNYTIETMAVTNYIFDDSKPSNRIIDFKSSDGNRIKLRINTDKIKNGDTYLIMYLPNSKIGIIMEDLNEQ